MKPRKKEGPQSQQNWCELTKTEAVCRSSPAETGLLPLLACSYMYAINHYIFILFHRFNY